MNTELKEAIGTFLEIVQWVLLLGAFMLAHNNRVTIKNLFRTWNKQRSEADTFYDGPNHSTYKKKHESD